MHPEHIRKIGIYFHLVVVPVMAWQLAIEVSSLKFLSLQNQIYFTLHDLFVLLSFLGGVAYSLIFAVLFHHARKSPFTGARFYRFLRGSRIVSAGKLRRLTREDADQVTLAGIPLPVKLEPLHVLVNGATGTGKSVLLRELVSGILQRGDRMIVIDPNG